MGHKEEFGNIVWKSQVENNLVLSEEEANYHISVLRDVGLLKEKGGGCYRVTSKALRVLEYLDSNGSSSTMKSSNRKNKEIRSESLKVHEKDAYGHKKDRVTVLGAFDTWPYMDYVCETLSKLGSTVFTSRFNYRRIGERVYRVNSYPDPNMEMNNYLHEMIDHAKKAVLVFSVAGGHYIEADWCYKMEKPTLGIAYVRDTIYDKGEKICPMLWPPGLQHEDYSICINSYFTEYGNAWKCMERGWCPFKRQGISLNVIEYFLTRSAMLLAAVARVSVTNQILEEWNNGKLIKRLDRLTEKFLSPAA
jgi:hypothetical protein